MHATLAIASVAIAFVYIGNFVWDASAAVSAFLVLLVVVTTPWIVILSISYFYRRGYFLADDLQVFTRGQVGCRYWFTLWTQLAGRRGVGPGLGPRRDVRRRAPAGDGPLGERRRRR